LVFYYHYLFYPRKYKIAITTMEGENLLALLSFIHEKEKFHKMNQSNILISIIYLSKKIEITRTNNFYVYFIILSRKI